MMKTLKFLLLTGLWAWFTVAALHAQYFTSDFPAPAARYQRPAGDRAASPFRFYGGFGMGFYNNGFYVDLQPGLMYRIKPEFYVGVNLNLSYQSYRQFHTRERLYIYGTDFVAMYLPWRFLELSADYQFLYVQRKIGGVETRWKAPAFYLGAGYRAGNVAIGLRYDILYNKNRSIYPSAWTPYIRVYF